MSRICIIGAFGFSDLENATGGQPVKTRTLYKALCDYYGQDKLLYVDTYRWKSRPLILIYQIVNAIIRSKVIIMLPAQNGLRVLLELLLVIKRKETKVFYDVIGGWLPEVVKINQKIKHKLKRLDGIWVETTSMKEDLAKLGINNVEIVYNFKSIDRLNISELNEVSFKPYHVCTFSRVMLEKGISEAIEAVSLINNTLHELNLILDIYGPIDNSYKNEFSDLILKNSDCVNYRGIVHPNESVAVLKDYDALLFPTKYFTEGIPGSIIDAYCAGVPVITSLWKNCGDVFWDGKTGWGYKFDDCNGLKNLLFRLVRYPNDFFKMKKTCLEMSYNFTVDNALKIIVSLINSKI